MTPGYGQFSKKEKTDMRRIRAQLSCAECRRLKLKCDRKVPCGSCSRRGCDSICPTGTLANGTGKKLVIADTGDLHHKVAEMGERIKALEQAIEEFQSSVSDDTHSLLRPELLNIKFPHGLSLPTQKEDQPTLELADALGTLTINENGSTKYFGSTAGAESLLMAGADIRHPNVVANESYKPLSVSRLQTRFPIGEDSAWDVAKSLTLLYAFLPPQQRAWALCEIYSQNGIGSANVITRSEIVDDILTPIYRNVELHAEAEAPVEHHKMATLFIVLGLGTLLDSTAPPYSPEADSYFDLGVSALNLHPLFSSPEIGTIQALLLMATYLTYGGRRFSMEGAWSMVALASKLGQSIGLHREGAEWSMLEPKFLDRRRSLFWDLYTYDVTLSVKLGRPFSIRLSYVDVPFPADNEQTIDEDGSVIHGYHWLTWHFSKTLLSKVAEVTLSATPPPYSAILDLDRILREKTIYKKCISRAKGSLGSSDKSSRPFLLKQHRAITGMYIHKSYFAQAVLTHPDDPLLSPYAASYLAAYRCASGLISMKVKYFNRAPDLLARRWSIWSSSFSASIIVGTVAIHTRDSHLAARAFAELCLAVELFESGAVSSTRAGRGLVILQRLRDRAVSIFSQQDAEQVVGYSAKPRIDTSDFDDELEIFGGQTRVVVSRLLAQRPLSPPAPQPAPMVLENNQQSLVDFFASQMGPDWTMPHHDDTLPIPQPQYNYDGGLPTDTPLFSQYNEDPSFANSGLSFDSNMSMNVNGGSSGDSFLRLLDEFSSDTSDFQMQDIDAFPGPWFSLPDPPENHNGESGIFGGYPSIPFA